MRWCKTFHFTGHGDYIPGSNSWLVTFYSENIRAWEIPWLGDVKERGGPTLLVFYNCCESGRVNWLFPGRWLCPASLSVGAQAAIGDDDIVQAGTAYDFAQAFYDWASRGYIVRQAFDHAKSVVYCPTAVRFGGTNTVLVG